MNYSLCKLLTGTFARKMLGYIPRVTGNAKSLWHEKCVAKQEHVLSNRSFHIGSACCVKIYVEKENEHAHSYLEKNPLYSSTLINPMDLRMDDKDNNLNDTLNQDWSLREIGEVFEAFRSASILREQLSLDINSPALENLCSAVIDKCKECEESQLLGLLKCLSLWPPAESIHSGQFHSLWRALDQVCLNRVKTWGIDMSLLAMEHWAHLRLARASQFVMSSMKRISRKLSRLSPQQFVQLMYYINLCRRLPSSASKFEFECTLEALCDKLTLEELSIVSMGFFKSQTHIKSQHITEKILSRLESCFRSGEPPPPDSIMLASLLKVLRNCVSPTQDVKLFNTLDAMLPHLKQYSLLCCLHAALIGGNIQLIHEGVMHSICERFAVEMRDCRLKDVERLAFILTLFNYDPKTNPCIYEAMVSEIRKRVAERERDNKRWEEIDKHGECLLRFLSYLSFRQIFPLDLIEIAMDPDFINKTYGNTWKMGREVLILDTCLELHFPEKVENRLSPKLRTMLSKRYRSNSQRVVEGKKLSAADRLHFDVLENIRSLSGSINTVSEHHILPQFERPDIVFCIGENNKFQNLSLLRHSDEVLSSCPAGSGIWYAVLTGTQNRFIKPSNQPVGPIVNKMSTLEKIGYKPIMVPWFEWNPISNDKKRSYLKQKIFT